MCEFPSAKTTIFRSGVHSRPTVQGGVMTARSVVTSAGPAIRAVQSFRSNSKSPARWIGDSITPRQRKPAHLSPAAGARVTGQGCRGRPFAG